MEQPKTITILRLEELTDNDCHWPIGDPKQPNFGFCGKPTAPQSRFCREHTWLAYNPGSGEGGRRIPSEKEQRILKQET